MKQETVPDSNQTTLGRRLAIDEGADLVCGHHPHVLQGIETYKGKNIIYSLGNFCFGGNSSPSDMDTMIYQQTFTIDANGVKTDNVTNVIPCFSFLLPLTKDIIIISQHLQKGMKLTESWKRSTKEVLRFRLRRELLLQLFITMTPVLQRAIQQMLSMIQKIQTAVPTWTPERIQKNK